VVDFEANRLRSAAAEASADYIDTAEALFDWLKGLVIEFKRRNARKRELMERGLDDAAVFAEMSKEAPICILIDDMAAFIRTVYQPPEGVGNMSGFLENVVEKGSLHHIYFFVCVDTGDMPSLLGRRVYDRMAAYRRGIFLGGNVAAQRLFDFSAMPYLEQSRSMKTGLGLLPPSEDEQEIRRVVIPYARG
jgi:S-DNA-T family DNA segregation ATPase FtsK/SpoIIIE